MTLNDISGDIISGLVVETVSKLFQKFLDRPSRELKIADAYFREKYVDRKTLKISSTPITPEVRKVVGRHIVKGYIYAETGSLFFSLRSKLKNIRGVQLIFSNDDLSENVNNIKALKNNLAYEKLRKKSRRGEVEFKTECELMYVSNNDLRIKNFLIFVDAGKYGYDMFVLQTVQSPIASYAHKFDINQNGDVTSYKTELSLVSKRNFTIKHRVVLLNNLDKIMDPFIVSNIKINPGIETLEFKNFIEKYNSAYNLRIED